MKSLIKGIILGIGGMYAFVGIVTAASPKWADIWRDTVHAAHRN